MRTIWQSLAWKEWHEHKWKLASVTAIVIGVSALPIINYDFNAFSVAALIAVFCITPLAVFIGAGEATGERARGTLPFTQALPVPMWHVASHKVVAGLLTCILPVLINLAFVVGLYFAMRYAQVEPTPRFSSPLGADRAAVGLASWYWQGAVAAIAVAVSLFLWTAAIGVNRKDEISASAWALAAIAAWWTTLIIVPAVFDWRLDWPEHWIVPIAVAGSPGGYAVYLTEPVGGLAGLIATALATLIPVGLATVFIYRFGSLKVGEAKSHAFARARRKETNWLDRPMSSPLLALAWKQGRESGPIALAGIVGIVVTSLVILLAPDGQWSVRFVAGAVAGSTVVFGFVATLVVGIGVFLNDLSPTIHNFWRSRPIEVNSWFWTKFAVGLLVLAIAFGVPLAAASFLGTFDEEFDIHVVSMWAVLVPLWIYSASIMMTALVRQAVYAGILSWGAMYLSMLLVVGVTQLVKLGIGKITWKELSDPTEGEMAATMILASIVFTTIAWLAVRNDWGRKSRY